MCYGVQYEEKYGVRGSDRWDFFFDEIHAVFTLAMDDPDTCDNNGNTLFRSTCAPILADPKIFGLT